MGNIDSSSKSPSSNVKRSETLREPDISSSGLSYNKNKNLTKNYTTNDSTLNENRNKHNLKQNKSKKISDIIGTKINRSKILNKIDSIKIIQIATKITNKVLCNTTDYNPLNLMTSSLLPNTKEEKYQNFKLDGNIIKNLNTNLNSLIFSEKYSETKVNEIKNKLKDKCYFNDLLINNKKIGLFLKTTENNSREETYNILKCKKNEMEILIKEKIENMLKETESVKLNLNSSDSSSQNKEIISGISSKLSSNNTEMQKQQKKSASNLKNNISNSKIIKNNESSFNDLNKSNDQKENPRFKENSHAKYLKLDIDKNNLNKTKTGFNLNSTSRSKSPTNGKYELMKNYNKMKVTGFFKNTERDLTNSNIKNEGSNWNSPKHSEKHNDKKVKELHLKIKINPHNRSPDVNKRNNSNTKNILKTGKNQDDLNKDYHKNLKKENKSYFDDTIQKEVNSEKNIIKKPVLTDRSPNKTLKSPLKTPKYTPLKNKNNKDFANLNFHTEVIDYKPDKFNPENRMIKTDRLDTSNNNLKNNNLYSERNINNYDYRNNSKDLSINYGLNERSFIENNNASGAYRPKIPETTIKNIRGSGSELIAKKLDKNKPRKDSDRIEYINTSSRNNSKNNSHRNSLIKKNDNVNFNSNSNTYYNKIPNNKNKNSSKNNVINNSNFEFSNNDSNFYTNQTESQNIKLKIESMKEKNKGIALSKNHLISDNEEELNNSKLGNRNSFNKKNQDEKPLRYSKGKSDSREKNIKSFNKINQSKENVNEMENDEFFDKGRIAQTNKDKLSKLKNLKSINKETRAQNNHEDSKEKKKYSNSRTNYDHDDDDDQEEKIIIFNNEEQEIKHKNRKRKDQSNDKEFQNRNNYYDNQYNYENHLNKNKEKNNKLKNRKNEEYESDNNKLSNSNSDVEINLIRKNTPTLGPGNRNSYKYSNKSNSRHAHKRSNSFGGFYSENITENKEEMLRDFNPKFSRESEEIAGEKFSFRNNFQEQNEIKYLKKMKEEKQKNNKAKNQNIDEFDLRANIDDNFDDYRDKRKYNKKTNENNNFKYEIQDEEGIKYIQPKIRNYDENQIKSNRDNVKNKKDDNRYDSEIDRLDKYNNNSKIKTEKPVFKININDLENEDQDKRKKNPMNINSKNKVEGKIYTGRNIKHEDSEQEIFYHNTREEEIDSVGIARSGDNKIIDLKIKNLGPLNKNINSKNTQDSKNSDTWQTERSTNYSPTPYTQENVNFTTRDKRKKNEVDDSGFYLASNRKNIK